MSAEVKYFEKYTKVGRAQQKMSENREYLTKRHPEPSEFGAKVSRRHIKSGNLDMVLDVITSEEVKEMVNIPVDGVRYIRAKDSQNMFKMDEDDWERARYVAWFEESPGVLTTKDGITFENYVGIIGKRRYPFNPRDKRRKHYHNC